MRKIKYVGIFILGIVVGIIMIGLLRWVGLDISLVNVWDKLFG